MKYRCIEATGFTVIELIVTIGISIFITSAAATLLITSIRSNNTIWSTLSMQQEGRRLLQEVRDDLRRAEVSSIGSYPIREASSYRIVFYANIDNEPDKERVVYWLDEEIMYKGVIKPSGVPLRYDLDTEIVTILATGVQNGLQQAPLFTYYGEAATALDMNLNEPISLTDIRMVRVTIDLTDANRSSNMLSIETLVQVRNVKQN
jgi:type II secretory pathway pseudopilin PulG